MKRIERAVMLLCGVVVCSLVIGGVVSPASMGVRGWLTQVLATTVFSSVYDTATPLGTDAPSTLDDHHRLTKGAIQERQNVDHYWPLSGTQVSDADVGEHRKVLFHAPIAATPTVAADHGDLRIKDVAGKAELHWTDEDENEVQITDVGTLNIVSTDILGTLANNTYFTAVDNAGTGTVDLIKANASDVAVIPDGSETATSGAPTADADIANKKYVDDQIASGVDPAYSGGESHTFGGGLILKMGTGTTNTAVTFGSAFPNALVSVTATYVAVDEDQGINISSSSTSAFTAKAGISSFAHAFNWIAIGH